MRRYQNQHRALGARPYLVLRSVEQRIQNSQAHYHHFEQTPPRLDMLFTLCKPYDLDGLKPVRCWRPAMNAMANVQVSP
jgi:hypothetical protein